jgi:hypothetical protein
VVRRADNAAQELADAKTRLADEIRRFGGHAADDDAAAAAADRLAGFVKLLAKIDGTELVDAEERTSCGGGQAALGRSERQEDRAAASAQRRAG